MNSRETIITDQEKSYAAGEYLRDQCRLRNISQKRIAVDLGIEQSRISKLINHLAIMRADELITFSEYFGVTPDVMLGYSAVDGDIVKLLSNVHGVELVIIKDVILRMKDILGRFMITEK